MFQHARSHSIIRTNFGTSEPIGATIITNFGFDDIGGIDPAIHPPDPPPGKLKVLKTQHCSILSQI
jgi:hypothetical protein